MVHVGHSMVLLLMVFFFLDPRLVNGSVLKVMLWDRFMKEGRECALGCASARGRRRREGGVAVAIYLF